MNNYRIEIYVTDGYASVQAIDESDDIVAEQTDLTVPEAMDYVARLVAGYETGWIDR